MATSGLDRIVLGVELRGSCYVAEISVSGEGFGISGTLRGDGRPHLLDRNGIENMIVQLRYALNLHRDHFGESE